MYLLDVSIEDIGKGTRNPVEEVRYDAYLDFTHALENPSNFWPHNKKTKKQISVQGMHERA